MKILIGTIIILFPVFVFASIDPQAALAGFAHSWHGEGISSPGTNGSMDASVALNKNAGPNNFDLNVSCDFKDASGGNSIGLTSSVNNETLVAADDGTISRICADGPRAVGTISLTALQVDMRSCQDFYDSTVPAQPVTETLNADGSLYVSMRYQYYGTDVSCSGQLSGEQSARQSLTRRALTHKSSGGSYGGYPDFDQCYQSAYDQCINSSPPDNQLDCGSHADDACQWEPSN